MNSFWLGNRKQFFLVATSSLNLEVELLPKIGSFRAVKNRRFIFDLVPRVRAIQALHYVTIAPTNRIGDANINRTGEVDFDYDNR